MRDWVIVVDSVENLIKAELERINQNGGTTIEARGLFFVFYVYKLSSYILCINLAENDGIDKCKF